MRTTIIVLILFLLLPVASSFAENDIIILKQTIQGGGGGGFTTDQNDELNTTGTPDFDKLYIHDNDEIGQSWAFGTPSFLFNTGIELTRSSYGGHLAQEIAFKSSTLSCTGMGGAGDCSDTLNQGYIKYSPSGQMLFYDDDLGTTKTLSQLAATDIDTNAGTLCSDGYYLDGDETCHIIPADTNTNAITECGADELLDGVGDCESITYLKTANDTICTSGPSFLGGSGACYSALQIVENAAGQGLGPASSVVHLDLTLGGVIGNSTDNVSINNLVAKVNEQPTSLWWNQSGTATYNGSVSITQNLNVSGNYQSLYDKYSAGHNLSVYGISNTGLAYGSCQYEGHPTLGFLCAAPYNLYDKPAELFINGTMNYVAAKLGTGSNNYGTRSEGNLILAAVTSTNGQNYLNGTANLVVGTGDLIMETGSEGNINIGNQNTFTAGAKGSGAFGQLHEVTTNNCYVFGAQNTCSGSYGFGGGYGVKILQGTCIGLGRGVYCDSLYGGGFGYFVNVTGTRNYAAGIYVKETRQNYFSLGAGDAGNDNQDISINGTHIIFNKSTIHHAVVSTGGNAGTHICLDVNNQHCPCGSCA